jgi:hypothetical protein
MEQVNMLELFKNMQAEMQSTLEVGRISIPHNGEMGEAAEESWRKWLRKYLPRRYCVDKAFVVDHDGNASDQIDIVIYDGQYSYFVFKHEQVIYVPAESVYAVIEVKQNLNKEHLDYAGDKAASVRKLKRTSVEIPFVGGIYRPKPLHKILSGIVTIESDWKDPLGDSLRKNLNAQDSNHEVDFGCAIKHGSFWVDRDTKLSIKKSSPDESLLFFFLRLLNALQSIGTVPAIDINEYAKVLHSFESE